MGIQLVYIPTQDREVVKKSRIVRLYDIRLNSYFIIFYRIARKFGRELNLAVWWSTRATAKLKSAKISYSHIYIWRSCTKPPNLNLPIHMQWQFGTQLPNLIPANISGYTVYSELYTHQVLHTAGLVGQD